MLQNRENNQKRIYKNSPKPFGHKVLSFYILDILLYAMLQQQPPLSVATIRKHIYMRFGFHYTRKGIESAINCIQNMQQIQLHTAEHTATGDAISKHLTKHFSITIKTTDNV